MGGSWSNQGVREDNIEKDDDGLVVQRVVQYLYVGSGGGISLGISSMLLLLLLGVGRSNVGDGGK